MYIMKNKSIYNAVVAFTLVVSLLIGAFLAVTVVENSTRNNVVLYSYELGSGYTATVVMLAACLVLFMAATFIFKKYFKKSFKDSGAAPSYAKLFLALSLVAFTVYSLVFIDVYSGYSVFNESFGLWNILTLVFAVGSVVYFALSVFCGAKIKSDVYGLLSIFPVLGLVIRLVLDYLVQNVNVHGDLYRFHLLALCALILFAINESRYVINKPAPSLYVFFGLAASLFSFTYALPTLALAFKGYTSFDENAVFCLVDIAFAVYIYIRLFSVEWRNKHEGSTNSGSLVAFDESDVEISSAE